MKEAFCREFLSFLFSGIIEDELDELFFQVFTLPSKRSNWFTTDEKGINNAVKLSSSLSRTDNIYFSVSLSDRPYSGNLRLNENQGRYSKGIVGLWADIDKFKGKKTPYPQTVDDCLSLLYSVGLPPTMVVETGGGVHAYWLFREAWIFESDEERQQARKLSEMWQKTILKKAHERGNVIDMTHDLERIMRVPGTINHNHDGKPEVRILEKYPSRLYNPSDFEEFIDPAKDENIKKKFEYAKGIHVNPFAQPPTKLNALLANDEEFAALFNGKRKRRKKDGKVFESLSELEYAFVNYLVRAGWSDQEITDFLVYYAREHAKRDKPKHVAYYARTVGRVRADVEKALAVDELEQLEEAREEILNETAAKLEPEQAEKVAADQIKEKILEVISRILGVRVLRFLKLQADQPSYIIETSRGRIDFNGSSKLLNPTNFQEKVFDCIGKAVTIKRPKLARMMESLYQVVEVIDLGEEATKAGALKAFLREYLEERTIYEGDEFHQGAFHYMPCRRGEEIFIFLNDFSKWVKFSKMESLDKSEVLKQFALMGIQRKTIKAKSQTGKTTTRNGYAIPVSWLDVGGFEDDE